MFGRDSLPCRVYRYGALEPRTNLDVVNDQMKKAHQYRNKLVEAELARRKAVDALLLELCPDLVKVEGEIKVVEALLEGTLEAIQKASAAAMKKVRPPELVAAAKGYREHLRDLRKRRKELRDGLFASPEFKEKSGKLDEEDLALRKKFRAESGLYFGTYLQVESSAGGIRSGAPPRFHRYDGHGHLAVQIQNGISIQDVLKGEDTRVQLVPVPPEAWGPGGRTLRRTTVRFRAMSKDGDPVFAEIPIVLHRPMPEDAVVKWVHLVRERVATKFRWSVQFVLARKSGWDRTDWASSGTVGMDVGWRMMPDGRMRVAVWQGDDGAHGEISLPKDWLSEMGKTRHLQSIRDAGLNEMKNAFFSLLGRLPENAWWAENAKDIRLWKAAARFAALSWKWREHRFPGDEDAFGVLDAWRKRDRHLYEYQANLRDQLLARRLDIYRNEAARLRRRYRTLRIEKLDLREFHELPDADQAPAQAALREHVRDAGLSYLTSALRQSMARVVEVDPKETTARCSLCGHLNESPGQPIGYQCASCGLRIDQDENAAINILRNGSVPVTV